jgi:hypothetical protein
MKDRCLYTTICYLSVISILIFTVASCISLKSNYLGTSDNYISADKLSYGKLQLLETQRQYFDLKADSILQEIKEKRIKRKPLTAREVNLLYTNFREQLNYDRIMNQILNMDNSHNDSLRKMQQFAALSLLKSAAMYNNSYQKYAIVRRSLNKGDIGNNIPERVLRKSRFFLYSTSIRKKILDRKSSIYLTSFKNQRYHLPKTNLALEAMLKIYQNNDRINIFLYKTFEFFGKQFFRRGPEPDYESETPERDTIASHLLSEIKPFDILLERSGNTLANIFIPGHFGHACIWLGSETIRLRKEFRNRNIQKLNRHCTIYDKAIAESVTSGARLCNLKDLSDGKTFIILRLKNITAEQKKTIAGNILKNINKDYDYNFNVESSDKINCTELVYLAYDFINWKERRYLGKYTIFPDDIVSTALNDNDFEIEAMLDNGKLIRHPDRNSILTLIEK